MRWGGYKDCKPIMTLFFHLFKVKSGSKSTNGFGIISLWQMTKYFEPCFDSVKNFKDHFFLVVPLNREAHSTICTLDPDDPPSYTFFFKYQTLSHFLIWVRMYRYKEEDFSKEELYLKVQLVSFFKELGFVGGVVLSYMASKIRLKRCIQTR